jgi:hypothetical protein
MTAGRIIEDDPRPLYAVKGSQIIPGSGSNSLVLNPICRKLWIGNAGQVSLRLLDSSTITMSGFVSGYMLDGIQFDQVLATGTTATLMIAFW